MLIDEGTPTGDTKLFFFQFQALMTELDMGFQISICVEALVTILALKRPLSSVYSLIDKPTCKEIITSFISPISYQVNS